MVNYSELAHRLYRLLYFIVLHFGLADCEEFMRENPATVHAVSTFLAQTVVPFLVRLIIFAFEGCIAYTERRRGVGTDGTDDGTDDGTGGPVPPPGGTVPPPGEQPRPYDTNEPDEETHLLSSR